MKWVSEFTILSFFSKHLDVIHFLTMNLVQQTFMALHMDLKYIELVIVYSM